MEKLSGRKEQRAWIRAHGSDAMRFLNGLWTCDFKRAVQGIERGIPTTGAGYILDTKGKSIGRSVFLCQSEREILLSVPAISASQIVEALNRLLVADDVELEVQTEAAYDEVWVLPRSSVTASEAELKKPVPDAKDRVFRAIDRGDFLEIPRGRLSPTHSERWWKRGAPRPVLAEIPDADWTSMRIDAGVPEWGIDMNEDSLILEFPFAPDLSFHKGCYVGQEVVARATYRGKMNRGFARFTAKASLEPGLVYGAADPERAVGKISSVSGTRGLGLIRFAATEGTSLFQTRAQGDRTEITRVDVLGDD